MNNPETRTFRSWLPQKLSLKTNKRHPFRAAPGASGPQRLRLSPWGTRWSATSSAEALRLWGFGSRWTGYQSYFIIRSKIIITYCWGLILISPISYHLSPIIIFHHHYILLQSFKWVIMGDNGWEDPGKKKKQPECGFYHQQQRFEKWIMDIVCVCVRKCGVPSKWLSKGWKFWLKTRV